MKKFKCPKCGGTAYERSENMHGDTSIPYIIECTRCGRTTVTQISPYSPTAAEAHEEMYAMWEKGEES